jgi:serine protease Do
MTDRPTDLSSLPSYQAPRRSLFSARKFALMASVVAGLGVAVYGFSPSSGPVDIFSSTAHAQVNNEVRKVAQPVGFADIVERVKPSVISVKVNINEKVAKNDSSTTMMIRRSSRALRWSASSAASADPMACRPACAVGRVADAAR